MNRLIVIILLIEGAFLFFTYKDQQDFQTALRLVDKLAEEGMLHPYLKQPLSYRQLNFSNKKLDYLPNAIGAFKKIESLDLSNNALTDLPSELGELKQLKHLDLSNNKFQKIPTAICKLENLQTLKVTNNHIKSIPRELGKLVKVKKLELNQNLLKVFPPALAAKKLSDSAWKNLKYLDLSQNEFGTIPSSTVLNLPALTYLDLSNTKLDRFPYMIVQLKALKCLKLADNHITYLEGLSPLNNLEYLDLDNNELKSLEGIEVFDELIYLNASFNWITTFPPEIKTLPHLKTLVLTRNQLEFVPFWLTRVHSLENINLSENYISPIALKNAHLKLLPNLKRLNVSYQKVKSEDGY